MSNAMHTLRRFRAAAIGVIGVATVGLWSASAGWWGRADAARPSVEHSRDAASSRHPTPPLPLPEPPPPALSLPIARAPSRPAREPFREFTSERTESLYLTSGPVPGVAHPNALVYVPAGLDRRAPLSVVVFFHGWHGCASVVAGADVAPCVPHGHRRVPLGLVRQMRAARADAVLIVPQFAMDVAATEPGTFRDDGGFRRFLAEILARIEPHVGLHRVDDLARVVLASHSAGFVPLLHALERGGVPVTEVALFDSMYDHRVRFEHWVMTHAGRFNALSRHAMRFVCVYQDPGIAGAARRMAVSLQKYFASRGRRDVVFVRDDPARLQPGEAHAAIVFARVPGDHAMTARANFAAVLRGAGL